MRTILFRPLVFLILLSSTFVLANAQDGQEPSGKILEIHSGRGPRPSVISLSSQHSEGFWASGFPRLKDWKIPNTGDPVHAMDFKARLVGDKAELTISLFTGKRFSENVENIAHVVISEGETIVVSELTKFGYEPVTVKMLGIAISVADVPLVVNPAPQLRTTVSNIVATLPTFKIRFQNDSGKEVMAFPWHTETGGRRLISAVAQGRYGKALIEANGSYDLTIKAQKREGDLDPVTMVVDAVIYRDGSVEGDTKAATSFLGYTAGRKKALEQLVPIFQKAVEKSSGRVDVMSLISKIDILTDDSLRVNGRPSTPIGISFAGTITEAIGFLRQTEQEFAGKSDAELAAALSDLAKFYRDWQTRMKQ